MDRGGLASVQLPEDLVEAYLKTHDFIQMKVLLEKVGFCHLCLRHISKISLLFKILVKLRMVG